MIKKYNFFNDPIIVLQGNVAAFLKNSFPAQGAFPARLKHVYILAAPLWFRASLSILSNFVGEKITSRVSA